MRETNIAKAVNYQRFTFILGSMRKLIEKIYINNPSRDTSIIILACSLHDLALSEPENYRKYYQNVDFCTNDSMLLTWYFRNKLHKKIDRIYGPDLMKHFLKRENEKHSKKPHFFLCPSWESEQKMRKLIKKRYPHIISSFGHTPRSINLNGKTDWIGKCLSNNPQFIWIGIGSPKQVEIADWMKTNSSIHTTVFCVGAAFDFFTGDKKQAPLFFQRSGLEWLFRLYAEPKRLWIRYLYTIPKFLIRMTLHKFFT